MNKNSGFTLIELIAIIILLGIIGVVSVPSITESVEKSKKRTLKTSAVNLVRAAEENCQFEKDEGEITKEYIIENHKISTDIDVKSLPKEGKIVVDDRCNAEVAVTDNGYCAIKTDDQLLLNKNIRTCTLDYMSIPKTKDSCFIFDEATRTITGYHFDNESCPTNISIPATINDVPVENIGDYAFKNVDADYMYYFSYRSNGWIYGDVILENFDYYDTAEVYYAYYVKRAGSAKKYCYYSNGSSVTKDLGYVIKPTDNIDQCYVTTSNIQAVSTSGKLTGVNFTKATNLKKIGIAAFNRNKIQKVYFGDNKNLTDIEFGAFGDNLISGTLDLTSLINLKSTGVGAFANNDINNVILPERLLKVDAGSFYYNRIENIELARTTTEIGSYSFALNHIDDITNWSNLEKIGPYSLKNNNFDGKLVIPNRVKYIDHFAFDLNTSVTSLKLGNDVEKIGESTFQDLPIAIIDFNDKLKSIGDYAFNGDKITKLVTPSSLEFIGIKAFSNNGMTELTLNEGLKTIKIQAFLNNYIKMDSTHPFKLPNSLEDLGNGAFTKNHVTDPNYYFITSVKNKIKDSSILSSITADGLAELTIPNTIKTIGERAFEDSKFTKLIIPNSVETIELLAFLDYVSPGGTINIGNGIKTINPNAFINYYPSNANFTVIIDKNQAELPTTANKWGNTSMTIKWNDATK